MLSAAVLHPPTWRSSFTPSAMRNRVGSFLLRQARAYLLDALERGIVKGQLTIEDNEGVHVFGSSDSGGWQATLKVFNEDMWARIFTSYDMGFSEAYMAGDFDVSSLKGLLNIWLDNRETLSGLANTVNSVFSYYSALAINALGRQNHSMARQNVEVAYNTSNEFFQTILSEEMMYSCAIWGDEENGVRGDLDGGSNAGDLEAAQHRKIHHLLRKARVRPGHRLLEIGSGWGAMAIEAAKLGCTVDTVTLSQEQLLMTEHRAREAGLQEKVRVHLCDYRELPASFADSFDALVTCEMIEAVGARHHTEFFSMVNWALKKDTATMVITATTQPEHRFSYYQPDDFARHYHWPNCHLPSATSLAVAVQTAVPGRFVLESIEDHGIHYPRTLREWGRRLEKNFHGGVVERLRERHPSLKSDAALQAFKRKWLYMVVYAEVGYARAYTSLHCWTFTRPENVSTVCS
ncbi:cyclopropane fatty acid synthase [Amylostereum chailletii]|nr:cyclopropane fatty acid synthase [Amylostereum chailletii]